MGNSHSSSSSTSSCRLWASRSALLPNLAKVPAPPLKAPNNSRSPFFSNPKLSVEPSATSSALHLFIYEECPSGPMRSIGASVKSTNHQKLSRISPALESPFHKTLQTRLFNSIPPLISLCRKTLTNFTKNLAFGPLGPRTRVLWPAKLASPKPDRPSPSALK